MTTAASSTRTPFLNLPRQRLDELKEKANALLARMTLAEKIGQMSQFTSDRDVTGPSIREGYEQDIREGHVGSIFNAFDADFTRHLQQVAVENSRLGIPLLFGYDVVHGFRTIFPIPLAMASSWNMKGIEEASRIAGREAAAAGIHWVFAPMVDVSRDARWGRVMEGAGEDPLLGERIAAAQVRGYQGSDIGAVDTVAACVKHYAGYAAAEAGRDYNTVDLSERVMRSVHLPPHKAAIDAGVATVMTSFNTVDGIPASCNPLLLDQILRKEWGFEGMVVTDYTAVMELIYHGVAADSKEAAEKAVNAGVDMDMQDGYYLDHLAELVAEDKVASERIDDAVRRILVLKYALGLFDDPYRYNDVVREQSTILAPEHVAKAREITRESMVLLKNEGVLPLSDSVNHIAVLGDLVDASQEWIGPWHGAGQGEDVTPLRQALRDRLPNTQITYASGIAAHDASEEQQTAARAEAIAAAHQADIALVVVGEYEIMSGEAASRTDIRLPAPQLQLVLDIIASGTLTVVVTMSGRPLDLSEISERSQALLHIWWPGIQGAPALVDILFGDAAPCGRLPMSFPRNVGQLPLYYGQLPTGRPADREGADARYSSKYIDSLNTPLYPFGFGLTYTHIDYGTPQLSSDSLTQEDTLTLSVELHNSGKCEGIEVVQLYLRDPVASISRPRRELIDFQRITLATGERRNVHFKITPEQLGFIGSDLRWRIEPGLFELHVGANVEDTRTVAFTYQGE